MKHTYLSLDFVLPKDLVFNLKECFQISICSVPYSRDFRRKVSGMVPVTWSRDQSVSPDLMTAVLNSDLPSVS